MTHEGHLRYRIGAITAPSAAGKAKPPKLPAWRTWSRRVLLWTSIAYLIGMMLMLLLLRAAPLGFWPIHLFVYGPRWVLIAPALALVLFALWLDRRRALPIALGALLVVLFPVMAFNLPWRGWISRVPAGPKLRVLTCNTGSGLYDPVLLGGLIAELQPDVVALQEWGDVPPTPILWQGAWHFKQHDRLCVASRHPIREMEVLTVPHDSIRSSVARFVIDTPDGPVQVVDLHLITPRDGLEPIIAQKWKGIPAFQDFCVEQWHDSDIASRWAAALPYPLIVTGDFNLPSDSPNYRGSWSRFTDAFEFSGLGYGPTRFTRKIRARIDHILAGPDWQPTRCWVGPDVRSDHRPVIADLVRVSTAANRAPKP